MDWVDWNLVLIIVLTVIWFAVAINIWWAYTKKCKFIKQIKSLSTEEMKTVAVLKEGVGLETAVAIVIAERKGVGYSGNSN